jgi:GTP-binding protein
LTHEGVEAILAEAAKVIAATPEFPLKGMESGKMKVYDGHAKKGPLFKIVKVKEGYFRVEGDEVVYMEKTTNLKTDEGVARFIHYLDKIGIEEALHKAGAKDGDTVLVGEFQFEYSE